MTSRIKGPEGSPIEGSGNARGVQRVRAPAAARDEVAVAASATDSVEITPSAKAMLTLQATLNELPDVDQKRVERIRLAIDSQTYRVDAGRIADRLLQLEGDLSSASQSRPY